MRRSLWLRNWRSFWRLEAPRKVILIEAALVLIAAGAAIRFLRFRRIAPNLGVALPARSTTADPEDASSSIATGLDEAVRIETTGWAISTAAGHLPWRSTCLVQAIAGKWMLRRRSIPSTLCIGVDRGAIARLEAHAWLRSGNFVLTGAASAERFNTIAEFRDTGA
jgi:hypothetical protein